MEERILHKVNNLQKTIDLKVHINANKPRQEIDRKIYNNARQKYSTLKKCRVKIYTQIYYLKLFFCILINNTKGKNGNKAGEANSSTQ